MGMETIKYTTYILNITAVCVHYLNVAIRLYRIKKQCFIVCSCNV